VRGLEDRLGERVRKSDSDILGTDRWRLAVL